MILDTNAISALAGRDAALMKRLEDVPRFFVTLISLGEYQFGLLGSSHQARLKQWLDAFLDRCHILSPNRETVLHYAAVRHEFKRSGTPIPANDVWIAALVRQHDLPIVSRDVHFDRVAKLERVTW
jgi:predicted nucleic acid-binding protein